MNTLLLTSCVFPCYNSLKLVIINLILVLTTAHTFNDSVYIPERSQTSITPTSTYNEVLFNNISSIVTAVY